MTSILIKCLYTTFLMQRLNKMYYWSNTIYSAAGKFVNPLEFSIFLHKYDPKHNQIFAQILKVDKENPIKQMRQKYFLSFIYSGKWSNIAYLWVAKVCESLGLAVNLKVKLESICAEVFSVSAMTIKCQYVTCFI